MTRVHITVGAPASGSFTPHVDRPKLEQTIAEYRAALAALEAAMVADCEREAARGAHRSVRIEDRQTWDKPTWQRYLAAAARHEPDYMPGMRRILGYIERLERLLAVTAASQPLVA